MELYISNDKMKTIREYNVWINVTITLILLPTEMYSFGIDDKFFMCTVVDSDDAEMKLRVEYEFYEATAGRSKYKVVKFLKMMNTQL